MNTPPATPFYPTTPNQGTSSKPKPKPEPAPVQCPRWS